MGDSCLVLLRLSRGPLPLSPRLGCRLPLPSCVSCLECEQPAVVMHDLVSANQESRRWEAFEWVDL